MIMIIIATTITATATISSATTANNNNENNKAIEIVKQLFSVCFEIAIPLFIFFRLVVATKR